MKLRKQNLSPKQRLKKRIHGYRNLGNGWVFMLESDFKGIFSPMMIKKGLEDSSTNFGENLDKLIEACSEEESQELNMKLDCYQIDNKQS